MGDGGTPSVMPVSVARYVGLPPTRTLSDHEPGSVDTTVVHGFVVGVAGWAQPTIGAPTTSGTHITGAPRMVTTAWRGMSMTVPPWEHITWACEVRMRVTRRTLLRKRLPISIELSK
jgi:hypothetical protein